MVQFPSRINSSSFPIIFILGLSLHFAYDSINANTLFLRKHRKEDIYPFCGAFFGFNVLEGG